jgi:hypothetical protein
MEEIIQDLNKYKDVICYSDDNIQKVITDMIKIIPVYIKDYQAIGEY